MPAKKNSDAPRWSRTTGGRRRNIARASSDTLRPTRTPRDVPPPTRSAPYETSYQVDFGYTLRRDV
jgi:hypothetical protein